MKSEQESAVPAPLWNFHLLIKHRQRRHFQLDQVLSLQYNNGETVEPSWHLLTPQDHFLIVDLSKPWEKNV